jgi:hypothetical protein
MNTRILCGTQRVGVFVIALTVLASCSGTKSESKSTTAATTPAPVEVTVPVKKTKLTQEQARVFSRMLYNNGQVGGADIEASFVYGPAATFTFSGIVDWANAQGDMMLTTKTSDGQDIAPRHIFWDRGTPASGPLLYIEMPGLEAAMQKKGRAGVKYVVRPINRAKAALDLAITYLSSLAINQPENPLLLRQDPEKYWHVGTKKIRGISVDQFGSGRSVYSADTTGNTVQVTTQFKSMAGPAVVDVLKLEKKTITLPPANEIVPASEIPEIMKALTAPPSTKK